MNLVNECTTKELKLLEEIGLNIENKEYSREELMMFKSIRFHCTGLVKI